MRVDTADLLHDVLNGHSNNRAHRICHPATNEEISFNIASESDFTEATLRHKVMSYWGDKIGDWNKSEFVLCENFAEVKQIVARRGAQKMTIFSEQWMRSGEGNNLVLVRFNNDDRGGFYLGKVQVMLTSTNQFGRDRRLIMDVQLTEVSPVTMKYSKEGRVVYRTVLQNLLAPARSPERERYLLPMSSIGKKVMVCKIDDKEYYAPYP